jgi:nucleotide-binding universal stress UspA family protein
MRYLVATDSVHTTAAACDHLEPRLAGDDTVVVTVSESRDGADALNVAWARLVGAGAVEMNRLDPAEGVVDVVLAAASDEGTDELVVGPHAGDPEAGPSLGTTARRIIEGADLPVVAVPLSP